MVANASLSKSSNGLFLVRNSLSACLTISDKLLNLPSWISAFICSYIWSGSLKIMRFSIAIPNFISMTSRV